jgi:hypothetical protein
VDEYYLRKGRLIHLITEWEDLGELDESTVDSKLQGYLDAYRKAKKELKMVPLTRETKFYSHKYGYCGRADILAQLLPKSWIWVIDVKSGTPHKSDLYQAPAYLFGLKDTASWIPPNRCADLYLRSNGTYRFEEVKNPTEKFLKFLIGLKQWRKENGIPG